MLPASWTAQLRGATPAECHGRKIKTGDCEDHRDSFRQNFDTVVREYTCI